MEELASCPPKFVLFSFHSNEVPTYPATMHFLAPLTMRYRHVTTLQQDMRCDMCGLDNKLPH